MSMNQKTCAPVVLIGYKRAEKLQHCIASLAKCPEASKTPVYIFCDGEGSEQDREGVGAVRKLVKETELQHQFSSWNVTYREQKIGLAANVIGGVTEVLQTYGTVITVEDDLIVSEAFLTYMNEALQFYRDDLQIWSISGYAPRMKALKHYPEDVWLGYRASSWGWATWLDRWETIDWGMQDYQEFLQDEEAKKRFLRGGDDMLSMLDRQMRGEIDSWAIRWCYAQSRQDKMTVFPTKSYIYNDGFDGSGVHSGTKDIYGGKADNQKAARLIKLNVQPKLIKAYYQTVSDTLDKKIKRNLNPKGIRKILYRKLFGKELT